MKKKKKRKIKMTKSLRKKHFLQNIDQNPLVCRFVNIATTKKMCADWLARSPEAVIITLMVCMLLVFALRWCPNHVFSFLVFGLLAPFATKTKNQKLTSPTHCLSASSWVSHHRVVSGLNIIVSSITNLILALFIFLLVFLLWISSHVNWVWQL